MTLLSSSCFVVNPASTTETYTLSLHDALPISCMIQTREGGKQAMTLASSPEEVHRWVRELRERFPDGTIVVGVERSEEHTSELQSLTNLVCRLLLEKKKQIRECHLRQRDSAHQ